MHMSMQAGGPQRTSMGHQGLLRGSPRLQGDGRVVLIPYVLKSTDIYMSLRASEAVQTLQCLSGH